MTTFAHTARFLYLSDTHLGASGTGYHQQTPCPGRLPEILAALTGWIQDSGGVDFVLHGGDMTDAGTPEQIREAVRLFALPVPVFLCLGNHDLAQPESLRNWMELGAPFFTKGAPDFLLETAGCSVLVLPNQWCGIPYFWEGDDYPEPFFLSTQEDFFRKVFSPPSEKIRILATHSPVFGLPVSQTGMDRPYHAPNGDFSGKVRRLVQRPPKVHSVFGAHSHLNMRVRRDDITFLTSSSLIETPFEFKLVEVVDACLRIRTISLRDRLPFSVPYDTTRAYVQGRTRDRQALCVCALEKAPRDTAFFRSPFS